MGTWETPIVPGALNFMAFVGQPIQDFKNPEIVLLLKMTKTDKHKMKTKITVITIHIIIGTKNGKICMQLNYNTNVKNTVKIV